jgi:hypothetical protein
MKKWWRRIRAALRMGLTWALAWFAAGMVLLVVGLVFGVTADVPFPIGFGLFGFIAGTAFSGVLGVIEGRRRFDQMSLPRFAGWGAVGGVLLTGIFVSVTALAGDTTPLENLEVLIPVFGLAGAGSAAGVLALARRAEKRELLEASEEVAEVGLSEDETRQLLEGKD